MKSVLVVDPGASIRRLVGAIFAGTHDVIEAGDGETGLGHVYADRPDLVLVELLLPDLSGLEFGRLVRGDPDLGGLRLIAMTGSLDPAVRQHALNAGFDALIMKPFRPAVLRVMVDALLSDRPDDRAIS